MNTSIAAKSTLLCSILILVVLVAVPLTAQDTENPLDVFNPFVGKVWLGHFDDPETAHFNHVVQWTTALDGKAVRIVKKVPELDFSLESVFYWDKERETVAYISLTNNGQHSRGTVSKDKKGLLVLVGVGIEKGGGQNYQTTFGMLADGSYEDRFYIKKQGGKLQQGHLIRYNVTTDPAFAKLFE